MQREYKVGSWNLNIGMPSNGLADPLISNNTHKYFVFDNKINNSIIRSLVGELINYYFKTQKNPKILERENRKIKIRWGENGVVYSKEISYKAFENFIKTNSSFDTNFFNLPPYECFWLDSGLEATVNWHAFDNSAKGGIFIQDGFPKQQYGEKFPIEPKINREGVIFSNFQPLLIFKIIQNRSELIENSHLALTFEWFYKLKSLINDVVSLVDITLNRVYLKAEYDPLYSWKFDKNVLERVGELKETGSRVTFVVAKLQGDDRTGGPANSLLN